MSLAVTTPALAQSNELIKGVEVGMRELTVFFSDKIETKAGSFVLNYELESVGYPYSVEIAEDACSVKLKFGSELPLGETLDLTVKNVGSSGVHTYKVSLIETVDFYGLKQRIETGNRTVRINDLTLGLLTT